MVGSDTVNYYDAFEPSCVHHPIVCKSFKNIGNDFQFTFRVT
jgi:hypothetical protein